MQTCGHTAFRQEARGASGALHTFRPPHASENPRSRQLLGSGTGSLRDASDLQAPEDGGEPGGSQPQVPLSGWLSSLPPPCPGSGAQVRWRCLHTKQQSTSDFQGLHLCPASPPALCFEPRFREDVISAKIGAGLRAG